MMFKLTHSLGLTHLVAEKADIPTLNLSNVKTMNSCLPILNEKTKENESIKIIFGMGLPACIPYGLTLQSYNNKIRISATIDPNIFNDPYLVIDQFMKEYQELKSCVNL